MDIEKLKKWGEESSSKAGRDACYHERAMLGKCVDELESILEDK